MASESASTYPPNGDRTAAACAQREQHWRKLLRRCNESGLKRTEFCRREGLKDTTLSWWARELRERDQARRKRTARKAPSTRTVGAEAFVPVRVIDATPREAASAVEVVTREGHVIRLRPGFDAGTLRRVIAALEGQPC